MSSNEFSAELELQPRLQRRVIFCGAIAGSCGLLMVLQLPLGAAGKMLACVASSVLSGVELARLRKACAPYSRLRITHEGAVALLDRDGRWQSAELQAGSWLLRRYGWIRLKNNDGMRVAALFRGHCRQDPGWRRLQIIWRHIGAAS